MSPGLASARVTDELIALEGPAGPLLIELRRIEAGGPAAPLCLFLHEGLGSVAMWKDFPQRLCEAAGLEGLVYSRPGYGRSTPRAADEHWAPDFMHRQALGLLPALRERFGHSDGGSIALIHAAHAGRADAGAPVPVGPIAGAVVLAPHIDVEDKAIAAIEAARVAYRDTDLRRRLGRYHDDPDSAFGGWNGAWLDPAFRAWSIVEEIGAIRVPLLAVQGERDDYGTMAQIRRIRERVPGTQLLELPDCGHSPHVDQPQRLIEAVRDFIQRQPHGDTP
ncbi:alpha/beta hydrolase [Piscinibacter sakaiensis]|uniref:alpha/beta fold hydrolase n=1 Tax=Piscinibacter sakaiensis TaxID=1547922 RepID=UPI003727D0EA